MRVMVSAAGHQSAPRSMSATTQGPVRHSVRRQQGGVAVSQAGSTVVVCHRAARDGVLERAVGLQAGRHRIDVEHAQDARGRRWYRRGSG